MKVEESSEITFPEQKEKKVGKEKKNNIIIIYKRKNLVQRTPSSSLLSSSYRSGKPDLQDNSKVEEKEQENKRDLLRNNVMYVPRKNKEVKEPTTNKGIERCFKIWDELAHTCTDLKSIGDKKRTTKIFKETTSVVRSFLHGTLPEQYLVVLPVGIDLDTLRGERTSEDFQKCVDKLKMYLTNPAYKNIVFGRKIDLFFFVAGQKYSMYPSPLIRFCLEPPKLKVAYQNQKIIPLFESSWKSLNPDVTFNQYDYQNIDDYLSWAVPHFNRLKKNLNSLGSFDDPEDVLDFFTFGVLRTFKERGKSFNTSILNQEFFKSMMEELRSRHGFTV